MEDKSRIFATNVNRIIKEKKLRVDIVAELSGISVFTLKRWLNYERTPNIKYVYEIAETLDVDVAKLMKPMK